MPIHSRAVPRYVLSASVFCALLSAASARADDWPTYQHDNAHTGLSPASFNPHALDRAWQAQGNYAVPVVVGNDVYAMASAFGTPNPTSISSFDLGTGTVHWQVSDQYVFPSAISVAGGLVVYTATNRSDFKDALYVRDAATGALKYTVAGASTDNAPTLVANPSGGVTAYVATGNSVTAYALGATSGSVLWSKTGSFGGDSIPTVVGNSLIVAGPFHYYAIDRATGAMNQFQNGGGSGGGGNTVVYDASRQQFYVQELYSGVTPTLTAYSYTDNSHITRLWQRTGTGIGNGDSVALGPDGRIYAADNNTLVELDPATGNILRSLPGQQFANGNAPILSNGYLWEFTGNIFPAHTAVYDLKTFAQTTTLPDSRGDLNTPFKSIGTLVDDHFLQTYGRTYGQPGFVVYTALPGDLDHNGHVDFPDLLALAQNYGQAGSYEQGDVNGDGQVNFDDLLALAQDYGQSIPPAAAAELHTVPEPSCLLLSAGALAFARRRKTS